MVLAELKEDVHVLAILEEVLEVAHVSMLDTPVDLNLTHKLLFSSAFGQTGLLDDFGGVNETCVGIYELIAFGESALAQELALDVTPDTNLATAILFKFLLDYRLRGAAAWLI